MAVKLRLTRRGKKKQPFYRIVATDSRVKRDGKYIEKIGHYNPQTDPAEIVIDEERAFYWLKNGAIPSDTVKSLLSKKGIWMKWALMKQGADEKKIEEEVKKWEVLQLERQRKLEALRAQQEREKAKQAEKAQKEQQEAASEVEDQPAAEAEASSEAKDETPVEAEQPAAEVEEQANSAQAEQAAEVEEQAESAEAEEQAKGE